MKKGGYRFEKDAIGTDTYEKKKRADRDLKHESVG